MKVLKSLVALVAIVLITSCQSNNEEQFAEFDWLSEKTITEQDLTDHGYKSDSCDFLRNMIYARHGYTFNDAKIAESLSKYSWYKPQEKDVYAKLTDVEKNNLKFLMNIDPLYAKGDSVIFIGEITGKNGSYIYEGDFKRLAYLDSIYGYDSQTRLSGWAYDNKLFFEETVAGTASGIYDGVLSDTIVRDEKIKLYKGYYFNNTENKQYPMRLLGISKKEFQH